MAIFFTIKKSKYLKSSSWNWQSSLNVRFWMICIDFTFAQKVSPLRHFSRSKRTAGSQLYSIPSSLLWNWQSFLEIPEHIVCFDDTIDCRYYNLPKTEHHNRAFPGNIPQFTERLSNYLCMAQYLVNSLLQRLIPYWLSDKRNT